MESYKTLMQEIKDDIKGWRNIPCSWGGRINIGINFGSTECNLQIQSDPYQITNGIFFIELEQKISQFIWKHKRPQIAKANLRKRNGAGGINLPGFRLLQSYSHHCNTYLEFDPFHQLQDITLPSPHDLLTGLLPQLPSWSS